MLTHDRLDSLGRFIGVVKRDGGDKVVEHVRFDDAVEQMATNEAELAVDSCCSSASKVPTLRLVVRKRRVCVLEEGDRHYKQVSLNSASALNNDLPSQWFTHRYGIRYQTARFAQPKLLPTRNNAVTVIPRPKSLSRMSLLSLASYNGLEGSKWLTPPPKPFRLPLPRPSL